jgi:TPR repeat protein
MKSHRWSVVCRVAALVMLGAGSSTFLLSPATAASLRQGKAAIARENYPAAAREFIPLAEAGNAAAQTYLGYMFQYGRGVPQNYTEAAYWYRRAAEQGNGAAQYSLGLLYDKGFGVREDYVEANKWLNLSAAAAPLQARDDRTRLRDAVATKMTRGQIAESRRRALEWFPQPELIGDARTTVRPVYPIK